MRFAAQLYTLRDHTTTAEGLRNSLARCAEMGYAGVQLSAVAAMDGDAPEVDAVTVRGWLDELGLIACATHRPLDRLRDHLDEEIEFHKALGCDYIAVSGAWGYPNTPDGYRQFLADVRPAMNGLAAAGISFGYHNHSHEFVRNPETGRPLYEVFLGVSDVQLEIDTYWVIHAGLDPVTLLDRAAGRIRCIHAKDMEVAEGQGPVMAPLGEGNLDWPRILDSCRKGGTDWVIVEQDVCRRDPFDCLEASLRYLQRGE